MTKGPGKGRGMLQMETWIPCRRPGQPRDKTIKPINVKDLVDVKARSTNSSQANDSSVTDFPTAPSSKGAHALIAKYNYKANLDKPGGFDEMSLTAGEKLTFVASHPENPYWWEARKETGEMAFIPASYVMILEKVTSLPWLEEKRAEREEKERITKEEMQPGEKPKFKPYTSAYAKPVETPSIEKSLSYFCEICNKQLNGIKPYQAHIVSKAHKDEVQAAAANNS